jgi:hypothetical protein
VVGDVVGVGVDVGEGDRVFMIWLLSCIIHGSLN